MEFTLCFAAFVLCCSISCYTIWKRYSFWSTRGISGPPRIPLFGSSLSLMFRSVTDVDIENQAKYGKMYGTYDGTEPVLVLSDPHLVNEIFVKNFSYIRNQFDCSSPHEFEVNNVLFATGDEWRRHRKIVNHCLSLSRVGTMCQHMDTSGMMRELGTKTGQPCDLDALFKIHTINMTTQVLLGLDLDLFHNERAADIVTASEYVFSNRIFLNLSYAKYWFISLLPFWMARTSGLMRTVEWSSDLYKTMISDWVKRRVNERDAASEDMIQSLIKEMHAGKMTFDEVVSNAIIATGAAWGTMQPTICFLLYELARNPEQQSLLQEEIDKVIGPGTEVTLDQLSKLVMMEAALKETLRMHPTEGRAFRRVSCPHGVQIPGVNGTLPEGTAIHVATYVMHHNADYWNEPETFDLRRFLPENRDQEIRCAFMGFSVGPRACPGQQMAMLMMKKTLAHVLREFTVSDPHPVHSFPANSVINLPYVHVMFHRRQNNCSETCHANKP